MVYDTFYTYKNKPSSYVDMACNQEEGLFFYTYKNKPSSWLQAMST